VIIQITKTIYSEYLRGGKPDTIVNEMIPLMRMIIGSWRTRFPSRADDISGVAWLALMKALTRAKDNKNIGADNIVGYLKVSVEGQVRNFLKDDQVIRVPRYKQDAGRKDGGDYQAPECLSMNDLDWIEQPTYEPDYSKLEFYEYCLGLLFLSSRERQILSLAREGYNNTEIGDKILVSPPAINRYKADLLRRFNNLRYDGEIVGRFYGN